MTRLPILAVTLLSLAGCGGGGPILVDLPQLAERGKIPVSVGAVEVREVTLPLYAGQETITVETPLGTLDSNPDLLWADDPVRSFTEGLALSLAAQTRARVAAEPWPFFENPDARVDVRFARALAGRDGMFRISGQYFVASADGERADVARRFALAEPYDTGNLGTIAAAKAKVIADLAALIARDGL